MLSNVVNNSEERRALAHNMRWSNSFNRDLIFKNISEGRVILQK